MFIFIGLGAGLLSFAFWSAWCAIGLVVLVIAWIILTLVHDKAPSLEGDIDIGIVLGCFMMIYWFVVCVGAIVFWPGTIFYVIFCVIKYIQNRSRHVT